MTDEERKARNREYQRVYREKHGQALKDKQRAYAIANQERIRANTKIYSAANAEAARGRARAWALANPERAEINSRASYAKNKDARHVAARERIAADPQKEANYMREYYLANREIICERASQWRQEHPQERLVASQKRRALKKGTSVGPIDYSILDTTTCGICGESIPAGGKRQLDHIIPLSIGGTHTQDNVQWSHPRCNMSKKAKDPRRGPIAVLALD